MWKLMHHNFFSVKWNEIFDERHHKTIPFENIWREHKTKTKIFFIFFFVLHVLKCKRGRVNELEQKYYVQCEYKHTHTHTMCTSWKECRLTKEWKNAFEFPFFREIFDFVRIFWLCIVLTQSYAIGATENSDILTHTKTNRRMKTIILLFLECKNKIEKEYYYCWSFDL